MLLGVLRQSARSRYQDVTSLIKQLEQFKVYSATQEPLELHGRMKDVEEIANIIPLSAEIAVRAELRGLRRRAPFKASDRNIYESLLHFAQA